MTDRRLFLRQATAAAVGTTALRGFAEAQKPLLPGLKNANADCKRLVGAFFERWQLEDTKLLPLILQNFNLITLGRMKWSFIRPNSTSFDFAESDWMADFCMKHSIAMHGHNLCWNSANPQWLIQTLTKSNAARMLTGYINVMMKRYAGRVTSWDVVNEPIASWMGRSDGMYVGPWLETLGPSYIDIAFHAAAEADPNALRVLNIAHVEQGGHGSDTARTLTLRLIESLMRRRVPLQAIGFESHLSAMDSGASTASRMSFVKSLKQFGLEILLTEIDVNDTGTRGNISARDAIVAECYKTYLSSILREAQPKRVVFFCFSDRKNWYDAIPTAEYRRDDGASHRPGLLDQNLLPKPAYTAALAALCAHC